MSLIGLRPGPDQHAFPIVEAGHVALSRKVRLIQPPSVQRRYVLEVLDTPAALLYCLSTCQQHMACTRTSSQGRHRQHTHPTATRSFGSRTQQSLKIRRTGLRGPPTTIVERDAPMKCLEPSQPLPPIIMFRRSMLHQQMFGSSATIMGSIRRVICHCDTRPELPAPLRPPGTSQAEAPARLTVRPKSRTSIGVEAASTVRHRFRRIPRFGRFGWVLAGVPACQADARDNSNRWPDSD